jgi:hypothetical protein
MSKYGCGATFTIWVPRGWNQREVKVRCGSTAIDGGVNQCQHCEVIVGQPPLPMEEEGDLEWDHRVNGGGE